MSQRLTDMRLTRVSLVDKGANRREFVVFKRASAQEGPVADPPKDETSPGFLAGILRKAADALFPRGTNDVAKTQTFASIVAGQELSEALDESFWTLQSALWSAVYATDADYQDLPLDGKKALVAQNLDEFKTYLIAQMDLTTVAKRDGVPAVEHALAGLVAKEGRKVSAARLERLKAAADALTSVLAEVDPPDPEGNENVTSDEIEAIAKRMVELQAEAVKKADENPAPAPGVKADDPDAPAWALPLIDVVEALADRVEKIETARGQRTSLPDANGDVKKRGVFQGVM